MKKILFLASMLIFASCSSDETVAPNETKATINGEILLGEQLRTTLGSNGSVQWAVNDNIGVFTDAVSNQLFSASAAGISSLFTSTQTLNGTPMYAYYPYSASNASTTLTFTVPAIQIYDGNGYANYSEFAKNDHKVSVDYVQGTNTFTFKQTLALLQFKSSGFGFISSDKTIQKLSFKVDGKNLAGTYKIDMTQPLDLNNPVVGTPSSEVVSQINPEISVDTNTYIHILPTIKKDDIMVMTISTNDAYGVKVRVKAKAAKDFVAGGYYTMTISPTTFTKAYFNFGGNFVHNLIVAQIKAAPGFQSSWIPKENTVEDGLNWVQLNLQDPNLKAFLAHLF